MILHSVEPAIVSLSPCWVRLFSGIAIDMLALYWLALVCTLQSLLSSVYRPAGAIYSAVLLSICWLSISLLEILHSVEPAIVRLSPCWVRLFSGIAIALLALYWLSLVLHSVERAIVGLSFCRSGLFRSIAIALLALYWLSLVCTLSSVLASVYRPAGAIYSAVLLSIC